MELNPFNLIDRGVDHIRQKLTDYVMAQVIEAFQEWDELPADETA